MLKLQIQLKIKIGLGLIMSNHQFNAQIFIQFENIMEHKKRSRSDSQFLVAHSRSMYRLKSTTKFKGVLQNMEINHTTDKQKNEKRALTPPMTNKNDRNDKDKQKKEKKQQKLPVIRKVLKLNALRQVKDHVPTTGYLEFETTELNKNGYISSTVSANGVILAEKNIISFLTMKQLEERQNKISKLKNIETFKFISLLKPFMKWKKYSKVKRFEHIRVSLKNRLNTNIIKERVSIHSQLVDFFDRTICQFIQFLLNNLNIISQPKRAEKISYKKFFVDTLLSGCQNITQEQSYKGSLSLLSDLQILCRLCMYSYKSACMEYSIKISQELKEVLEKQINKFSFWEQQYIRILQGSKLQQPSQLPVNQIKIELTSSQILFKFSPVFFFKPFDNISKEINMKDYIFNEIRNDKSNISDYLSSSSINIRTVISKLDFAWQENNSHLQSKLSQLSEKLQNVSQRNLQNCGRFMQLVKKQLGQINDTGSVAPNKIFQIQSKLQKIKCLPQQIYCGMLVFNFLFIKKKLSRKISRYFEEQCKKLPKNIDSILNSYEMYADQLEKKIEAQIWTIQAFVNLTKDLNKFALWKQANQQKNKQIQRILSTLSKINPRKCQKFSVRYIQLKQKLHEISIKGKAFEKSLPLRIKHIGAEKKKLMLQSEENIRQIVRWVTEIRLEKMPEIGDKLQKIDKKIQETNIGNTLESLQQFIQIQRPFQQKKQLETIKKIKDNYNNYIYELNLYQKLYEQKSVIENIIKKFIKQTGSLKVIQIKNEESIETIKQKIIGQKKEIQQYGISMNPLLCSYISQLNSYLQFFRYLAIIKRSVEYQDDGSKHSQKTVVDIYQNKQNSSYKEQLNIIEEEINVIESYKAQFRGTQSKIRQNKIFFSSEINSEDQEFQSIDNAIDIFNEAICIQNNKIESVANLMNDNWRNFLKEDISKTIQSLKTFETVVLLLKRMSQLRKIYNKKKQIIQFKFPQTLQKVQQKWEILFNHFQECLLIDFIKKIKNFQKMLGEVAQIQVQAQEKIEILLTRAYSSFPLYNLFEKHIVIKSILDPIFFLKNFFDKHEIRNQNNGVTLLSKYEQKIRIEQSEFQMDIKSFFNQIQKKIKSKMIQIGLSHEHGYYFLQFLSEEYEGIPIQILSFIDLVKLSQNTPNERLKQKLKSQIEQLTKTSHSLTKTLKNSKLSIVYVRKLLSVLLMNRLEARQIYGNNSRLFYPCYQFCKDQSQFYFTLCNMRTKVGYQLTDIQKNTPITSYQELYLIANIHKSCSNSQSTIILTDNSVLENYSFRTMRYYFTFPLLHNRLHAIIFSALRSRAVISFEHKQPINAQVYKKVHDELLKIYTEKRQKFYIYNSQNEVNFSWPIFLSLSIKHIQYKEIPAQTNYFFRNLKPISPQSGFLFEWMVRQEINSSFSSYFLKYSVESDLISKNNRYAQLKRIFLKFMKMSQRFNKSKLRPQMSASIFKKILCKIKRNSQLRGPRCKITFNQFLRSIKEQLFTYLSGKNYQQMEKTNSKFQVPESIASYFHVRSNLNLKQQDMASESLQSMKSINIQHKKMEENANMYQQKYYVSKIHQFIECLRSNNMVVVLGENYSGKSYFLKKFFKMRQKQDENVIYLHPKALGKQLWQQKNSVFKNKMYQNNRHVFIFEGEISQTNYYSLEKVLQNKELYYESGQKVGINPKSHIIFQAQNSSELDPYILVQLQWMHLKEDELKWEIILKSKLNTLKQMLQQSQMSVQENVIKQVFAVIEQKCNQVFTQIFSSQENKQIFIQSSSPKVLIVKTFNLFNTLCPVTYLIDFNFMKSIHKDRVDRINIIFQILCYCFLLVLNFVQAKDNERVIQKIKSTLCKKYDIDVDKPGERLFRIEQSNQKLYLKFQAPSTICYKYYSIYSSLKIIPNYKWGIKSHLVNLMIQKNQNILIVGKEYTGKSSFITNLPISNQMENFVMIFAESYSKLVNKIRSRSQFLNSHSGDDKVKPQKNQNIILFIEDCGLSMPENDKLVSKLKYLWEQKQYLQRNSIVKEQFLSFVIKFTYNSVNNSLPKQFYHLNQIRMERMTDFEIIFNSFYQSFSDITQTQSIQKQLINQYEHTQINAIIKMLENMKRTFLPIKIEAWKHKYEIWLITESITIVKNLFMENKISSLFNYKDKVEETEQLGVKLLKGVQLIALKLISFQLSAQELKLFNKFFKLNDNLSQKFMQYFGRSFEQAGGKLILNKETHEESNERFDASINNLFMAIQLRKCVIVQHLDDEAIGSCALYALNHIKNYLVVPITQNFLAYKNFFFYIEQKNKLRTKQKGIKKIIYYCSGSIIKQNKFFILNCISQYIRSTQSTAQFAPHSSLCFVVEYDKQDGEFVKKIFDMGYMRRKSAIVSIQSQKTQNIETYLNREQKQKLREIEGGKNLMVKLQKIIEYIQMNYQKSLNKSVRNNYVLPPLSENEIKKIVQKVVSIYCHYLKLTNLKQNVLKNAISQLQKLLELHQDLGKKQRSISGLIRKSENQIQKLKQYLLRQEENYQKMIEQLKKNNISKDIHEKEDGINPKKIEKQRKKLKKGYLQALALITRTDVSELKYIAMSNKELYFDLCEGICLSVTGESDNNIIEKISLDVNLVMKIREAKFSEKTTQCLKMIINKTSEAFKKMQHKHILRKITQWAYYGASLELFKRNCEKKRQQFTSHLIQNIDKKGFQNDHAKNLQEISTLIERQRQKLLQLELKLDQLNIQLHENRQKRSDLENFDTFTDVTVCAELQLSKLKRDKESSIINILYCVLCYEILPSLSSCQLLQTKKMLITAICQNQSNIKQQHFKNLAWHALYNDLTSSLELGKTNAANSKLKIQRIPQQKGAIWQDIKITDHQMMKLTYFLQQIQNGKNIVVINRQGVFQQLLKQVSGSLQLKQQNKTLSDVLCHGIEIEEEEWENEQKNKEDNQNMFFSGNRSTNKKSNQTDFYVTNSLGLLDLRFCSKKMQKVVLVDFGVDGQDINQIFIDQLQKIKENKSGSGQSYLTKQKEQTVIKNMYIILEKISSQLPRLCLCKSHTNQINQIASKIKKQIKFILQYANRIKYEIKKKSIDRVDEGFVLRKALELATTNSEDKILRQLEEIYQSFQYCHKLVLQAPMMETKKSYSLSKSAKNLTKQALKLVNLPQKYMYTLLNVVRDQRTNFYTVDLQKQLIIQQIKNIMVKRLFQSLPLSPKQQEFQERNKIDIKQRSPIQSSQNSLNQVGSQHESGLESEISGDACEKKVFIKVEAEETGKQKPKNSGPKQDIHKFCLFFRLVYFFCNHSPKSFQNVAQKDIKNILSTPPLDQRLKKLLHYRGVDPELIFLQQLPHKNMKLENQAKYILELIRKPEEHEVQQKIRQQTIQMEIKKIKQLNFIQKLILIRIFSPNAFSSTILEELKKMVEGIDKNLRYIMKSKKNLDSCNQINNASSINLEKTTSQLTAGSKSHKKQVNLLICLCDINFWSIIFQEELNKNGYQYAPVDSELNLGSLRTKLYCFSSLTKLPYSVFHTREIKTILVMDTPLQQQSIKNELLTRKISYNYISMEKLLQSLWDQLIKNKTIYEIFQVLQSSYKNKCFVEKYLQYRKFQNQFVGIYEQILKNNQFQTNMKNNSPLQSGQLTEESIEMDQKQSFILDQNNEKKNKRRSKRYSLYKQFQYYDQEITLAKKIYLGIKRAQVLQAQLQIQDQMEPDQPGSAQFIRQFFQILEYSTHFIKICHLKSISQQLRQKLSEVIAISMKNAKNQRRQLSILKKYSNDIYEKIKKQFFSQTLTHQQLVLRSTDAKQKELNQLLFELYQTLFMFCRFKGGSADYLTLTSSCLSEKTIQSLRDFQNFTVISSELNLNSEVFKCESKNKI